jgi:hypothetical protein
MEDGVERSKASLALVLSAVAAFAIRALFCLWLFPSFLVKYATVGGQYFFDTYREIAIQVLAGNGYRVAPDAAPILNRPPGYTLAMALTMPQLSSSPVPLHILNSLLGAMAAAGTYLLARSCGLSSKLALFASAVVALWPFLIWECKVSVPENLLVALFPFFLLAVVKGIRASSLRWACIAAILAACLALTHGLYQTLIPLGALAFLMSRRRLLLAGCFLCLSGALLAPWLIRNYRTAGYNTGVASGFGYHYFKGLYTYERLLQGDYFRDFDAEADAYVRKVAGLNVNDDTVFRSDPLVNRNLDAWAKADIWKRPWFFISKGIVRLPLVWLEQQSKARSLITALLLLPLVILAFKGFMREGLGGELPVLALMALAMNFLSAAIFPEAMPMRYALPWLALLSVLSARGLRARAKITSHSAAGFNV